MSYAAHNRAYDALVDALPKAGCCHPDCPHADLSKVSEAAILYGVREIKASPDPEATAQAWIAENIPGGAA